MFLVVLVCFTYNFHFLAVPSLNLPRNEKIIGQIINVADQQTSTSTTNDEQSSQFNSQVSDHSQTKSQTNQAISWRKQLEDLKRSTDIIQNQMQEDLNEAYLEIGRLKKQNKLMQDKLEKVETEKESFKRQVETMSEVIRPFLTEKQVEFLIKKKKKITLGEEELQKAFSLRILSQRAYEHLRTALKYPLPCLRTLRGYATKLDLKEGPLEKVLSMMKLAGENMVDQDRLTVLQFDEMHIRARLVNLSHANKSHITIKVKLYFT